MNIISVIQATILMYVDCAKLATRDLRRSWTILIGSILAFLLFTGARILCAPLGIGGGFLLGMIAITLLSMYYSWIAEGLRNRISFRELWAFDFAMFQAVISIAFIFFLVSLVINPLAQSSEGTWIVLCVNLGIVIIFNAIPEVIHQRGYDGLQGLAYAAKFTRENWIEWFLPLLILVAPALIVSAANVLAVAATTQPLLPALVIVECWLRLGEYSGAAMAVLGLLLGNWFMLFRAHLFNELESGNRRSRIYRAKQR